MSVPDNIQYFPGFVQEHLSICRIGYVMHTAVEARNRRSTDDFAHQDLMQYETGSERASSALWEQTLPGGLRNGSNADT